VLGIPPGHDGQTDRRTDRIPIANTRSQQYLPVQLSRVKITGARLTEDLRMILREFSHLQSSQDNKLIYRTLTTYLKTGFKMKSCNFATDLAII